MKTIEGDLIELAKAGRFDVMVHGCNCFGTMGAGVAKAIATSFPQALAVDRATPLGERAKLGIVSIAEVDLQDHRLTVVNAYTQFDYRGRGVKVDYDALRLCFERVAEMFPGARIGYPMIGAGLAGEDWSIIEVIIDEALEALDHTLILLRT
ncbi:macro domain-containing protein [Ovoidimarina sediminis]|uniref:macro domain-containing protein n=1 Tax=Ovoidimarina sediminis TaxID=3079856 RepID=UPI0029097616|nr:macro domain-containing protein [Rhodophyticola sp. MJ-SS7]MDU8942113.1 macro domain-containing protein [Rhodophyticola sp. MJ-SS7]